MGHEGWLLELQVSPDDREMVSSLLWDTGTTGIAETPSGLVAGFPDRHRAESAAGESLHWPASVRSITTTDWQGSDQPTEVVVEAPGRPPIALSIVAGPTFGHGGHPTTALAIELLSGLAGPGRGVLDVGTGSGVLAIAAAALGSEPVVGIDIDEAAVEVARTNAADNQVDIIASSVEVEATPGLVGGHRFDLVVVNVLAPVHQRLAPAIARVLTAGGSLVTAGYLEPDADAVVLAHTRAARTQLGVGVEVIERRTSDGWVAHHLGRSPEAASDDQDPGDSGEAALGG